MLFAAVVILGFATQETTHADVEIPRITSINPVNFVALGN